MHAVKLARGSTGPSIARAGRPQSVPRSGGFGASLVDSIATAKLGGRLSLEMAEHGLSYSMEFPAARLTA